MLILFEHPLSPYAQKNKIAMLEKNLEFETRLPNGIGSGAPAQEEFAAASPRREVPVLVDGERTVFDSSIILEYLEDAYPQPPLLPQSAGERARVRMLEEVMDHHYEPINWGLSEIRYFRRAEGAVARRLEEAAARQTARLQSRLEAELEERAWFNGASFGWGDLAVVPFVNGSVGFGLAPAAGSRLADWLVRANERPSVARVREEAAAAAAAMRDVAKLVEAGEFKRQYRDHRLEWMIRSGGLEVVVAGLEKDDIRFNELA